MLIPWLDWLRGSQGLQRPFVGDCQVRGPLDVTGAGNQARDLAVRPFSVVHLRGGLFPSWPWIWVD